MAAIAGLHTALTGARSVPGRETAGPQIESELRYYGAFYAAFGAFVLRTAPRAERDPEAVRALAAALMLGGIARGGGWLAAGRPHPVQRALLAIELGAPALIVGWQARLSAGR